MTDYIQSIPPHYFDVHVGLMPDGANSYHSFALVKGTFSYKQSPKVALAEPITLFNNIFDLEEKPRIQAGTDFWPIRPGTDIALKGAAVAPGENPIPAAITALRVGKYQKRVAVFGKRTVACPASGRVLFSKPEPFEQVALTLNNAYGGIDWRVPVTEPLTWDIKFRLQADHPGLYPRNHHGKGYVVLPDPEDIDGIELPNLENPEDLLTEDRLIVGDPRNWHEQPMPWCYDWTPIYHFPRSAYFGGTDGWYPAPENSVSEVRTGLLPKNYRTTYQSAFVEGQDLDLRFFSEASPHLSVPFLSGNEPVVLDGFSAEGRQSFSLPGNPKIELFVEKKKVADAPKLHSLLLLTEDQKFCMVWGITATLPRPFIPGIHKKIPVACRINDGPPIEFAAPTPVEQSIKEMLTKNNGQGTNAAQTAD